MNKKLIFVCRFIPDNVNSTRYQRAKLLADNYEAALICNQDVPKSLRTRFNAVIRVRKWTLAQLAAIIYLRLKGFRIIHTQYNLYAIAIGYIAKRFFGFTWIYDLWDHPSLELAFTNIFIKGKIKSFFYECFGKKALLHADIWVIGMHPGIVKHLPGSRNKKTIYVTNGIEIGNTRKMPVQNTKDEARTLRISYAGWVTAERGIALILEYLHRYNPPDAEFLFWGRTNRETLLAIETSAAKYRVKYLGLLDHKESLSRIERSDVCLCILDTSILNFRYAYPIKLFEYLAAGKVVIASRTEATSEILVDGRNGFLIDNDVSNLAAAFRRIRELQKEDRLEEVKQNAIVTAQRYDWNDINSNIIEQIKHYLERVS